MGIFYQEKAFQAAASAPAKKKKKKKKQSGKITALFEKYSSYTPGPYGYSQNPTMASPASDHECTH